MNKGFKGTVVNLALLTLQGELLEITLTVFLQCKTVSFKTILINLYTKQFNCTVIQRI